MKGREILINGHTDSDGSEPYNLHLSLRRAEAVKTHLVIVCRVPESMLRIRAYGEALPLLPNTSEANKRANRRVELEVSQ